MPRDEGNSNSQQNKTLENKKLNDGLLKHRPDPVLLLTARTPIQAGRPSLISYIQQKSRQVGEIGGHLARYVAGRDYLASTVLRATRLPLLSRAFDYISRKTTFITPMLQRMLDLPWFRRKQKPGHSIKHAAGATINTADVATGDAISLRSAEPHPDTLLRNLIETEGQLGDEADEIYPPVIDETYPMIISDRTLPPATSMKTLDTTSKLPRYPLVTSRCFDIKQGTNRMTNESSRNFTVSRVEPPRLPPDTTSKLPRHTPVISMPSDATQIINRMKTESDRGFIGSRVETPLIPLSGTYRSREIEETDRKQFEGTPENLTEVDRQPQSTQQPRKWSQVLMTLARRVFRRHKPTTVRQDIAAEDISEVSDVAIRRPDYARAVEPEVEGGVVLAEQPILPFPADTPITGESHEAAVQDVRVQRKPTSSKQPFIFRSKSPSTKPPARSGQSIFRSILDLPVSIPGPPIMRKAAKYISQLVSKQPSSMTSTADDGSKVAPVKIAPERVPQAGQPRHEPVVSPSLEPATPKDSIVYRSEDISDVRRDSDTLDPLALEYGGIEQGYIPRRMKKPWLRRESQFINIPPVQPLSVPGIHRTISSPYQRLFKSRARTPISAGIEDYGFQRDQEYMPSASGYEYGLEPAMEMPVPSIIQPKAEFDAAYSQELLTARRSILPELTYTRSQNLPEPEPTQVSRALEEPSRSMAIEPEEGAGEAAAPDINVIARDVYRLLRRRLINERERALGVV